MYNIYIYNIYMHIYLHVYICNIYIMTEKETYTIFRLLSSEKTEQLICNIQYFSKIFAKHNVARNAFWN